METNFARPKSAARDINNWVGEKTKGKMDDFIKPSKLEIEETICPCSAEMMANGREPFCHCPNWTPREDTKLLLVNAVYFKADWANGFDKRLTHSTKFWFQDRDKRRSKKNTKGNKIAGGGRPGKAVFVSMMQKIDYFKVGFLQT